MPVRRKTALVLLLLAAAASAVRGAEAAPDEGSATPAPSGSAGAAAAPPPAAGIADTDLDTLFDRMNQNGADLRSGHLVLRTELTSFSPDRAPRTGTTDEEAWFDGARSRIEHRETGPRGPSYSQSAAFDGHRLTTITTSRPDRRVWASVSEAADLSEFALDLGVGIGDLLIRWPLTPAIWHDEPLGARLATRRVWLPRLLGEERVAGLSCLRIVLLPQGNDPETTTYESLWVAPDRGYTPAKFERHTFHRVDEHRSIYGDVWQAEEWINPIEGLWLPSVTTRRRYEQGSHYANTHCYRTEVLTAEFNTPIPDDVFHLEVPEDAETIPPPAERARFHGHGRSGSIRGRAR